MNAAVRNSVLVGDALQMLRRLPDESVDTVITSPPYFLLRNYFVAGQLGQEEDVEAWVTALRAVMAEVRRVLKESGTCFLNLGDSYSRHPRYGAPRKSLLLAPERLLGALVTDGWTCRNKIVWAKTNALPTSIADRFSTTWEPVYFLTKAPRYFFALDAVRIPHTSAPGRPEGATRPVPTTRPAWAGPLAGTQSGLLALKASGRPGHPRGKNPGDVWRLATASFRGRHFATFPPALVERLLLAGCPERTCRRCGTPWHETGSAIGSLESLRRLRPTCRCRAGHRPGVVLDPFFGAGTVGLVAEASGRDWIGIELNPDYAELAELRIEAARQTHATKAA